ncbi:MAG: glycosyltransferase [ANME-2 cluster archaeon]|nr:glycosyltransferase [ANME-2 cluster archaeon]
MLNWNGKQYLETCLSSLVKQDYPSLEIIFVDNGSSDGSIEFVEQNYPHVIIVSHSTNLGFAQGINSGIKVSRGKYLATINNDAEADPEWISRLVNVLESDSQIGCCASKMLRYYDRNVIDSAGVEIYQNGNAYDRGANEKDTGQYDSQVEVFGACAGAALYRRQMLDEIGCFDKDYFVYFEDVDLSFRMHLFGWKCVYVPDAIVYHMHSATSKQASPFKLFYLERNKLWNMWKYYPLHLFIKQIPYTNIFYVKYVLLFFNKIVKKESPGNKEPVLDYHFISIVHAVLRAKVCAYAKLPFMVMQRLKLQSKGANKSELERWIIKGYKK